MRCADWSVGDASCASSEDCLLVLIDHLFRMYLLKVEYILLTFYILVQSASAVSLYEENFMSVKEHKASPAKVQGF
jgi:hypothetical protein